MTNKISNVRYIERKMDNYPDLFISSSMKEKLVELLTTSYDNRSYHNLEHITDSLKSFYKVLKKRNIEQSYTMSKTDEQALFCAILFHDIVYEVNGKKTISNEEASANLFEEFFTKYVNNKHLIATTKELIVATEHQRKDFEPVYAVKELIELMEDIDLSILCSNKERYLKYTHQVREEYAFVNDIDYAKGRTNILVMFKNKIDEDTLYKTKEYKSKSSIANENLTAEIAILKKTLDLEQNKTKKNFN